MAYPEETSVVCRNSTFDSVYAVDATSNMMAPISYVRVGGSNRQSLFAQMQSSLFSWWVPPAFQRTRKTTSICESLWDVFMEYQRHINAEVGIGILSWRDVDVLVGHPQFQGGVGSGSLVVNMRSDGCRELIFCGVRIVPCLKLRNGVCILYGKNSSAIPDLPAFIEAITDVPMDHRQPIPMSHFRDKLGRNLIDEIGVPFALYK